MSAGAFPHAYPFRLVDAVAEAKNADFSHGRVRIRVSSGARASEGTVWGSRTLLAEAIAQSALLLEGGEADAARRGFLAGISGMEFVRAPEAGETLDVSVRLAARFGPVVRFDGEVTSAGELLARGSVLVRRGEAPTTQMPAVP